MKKIDIPLLKSLVDYNPDTGVMTWKPRSLDMFKSKRSHSIWSSRYEGKEVGCIRTLRCGYRCRVFHCAPAGGVIYAHKAAWAIMTGTQPPAKIDHINQDATDNKWDNLRDGSDGRNEKNMYMRRDNTSGYPGVSWSKQRSKWEAHVGHKGRKINLGLFEDVKDAAIAAKRKREELGFSSLHGRPRK